MKRILISGCLLFLLAACSGEKISTSSSHNTVASSHSNHSSSLVSISSEASSIALSSSSAQSSSTAVVNACDDINQNIALDRFALASSYDPNLMGVKASDAFDGDATTRWSSNYEEDQWLQVDLGAPALICTIDLQWEAAYASGYRVLISDNAEQWQTLITEDASDGGIDQIQLPRDTTARYVRIAGQTRATQWGISLWEVSIMGDYQGLPVAQWSLTDSAGVDGTVYTVTEGTDTQLDATASFDNGGMITAYNWREINGEWSASGQYATYPAATLGEHLIQLTITDNDGNQASAEGTIEVTAKSAMGNPVCERAYVCEGFENGFGSGRKVGDRGSIDNSQGANGSGASYHYNTNQNGGNAWVEFADTAFNSTPEVWVSYYQKVTKTPVPTNWYALISSAASEFPAFRLGTQKYAENIGANGVLGNWSCWNGHPCPAGFPAGYDQSIDPPGGRRTLPNNEWVCIEVQLKKGPVVSVYLTPSIRGDIPDGGAYFRDSAAPGQFPVEVVKLGYNPQSDSLEGWIDDVIIAPERPGCAR